MAGIGDGGFSGMIDIIYKERRIKSLQELREELKEFSHDGLVLLIEDLSEEKVLRGTWSGCPISYKRGYPGSCRRDRNGSTRNAFTIMWDNCWLGEEEVLVEVMLEIDRRKIVEVERVEVEYAK